MQKRKEAKQPPFVRLSNKCKLPLIGLGTYKLIDKQNLVQILRKAISVGYKHIDTARLYNNQIPLGEAIQICINQGRCKREQLFIATKTFNHIDKNPVIQLKQALKNMNLTYVDIYYLHWPISGIDNQGKWTHRQICDIWSDMQQCVKKGYAKYLGNIMDLLSFAKIRPIINQIQFHPYLQQHNLVENCQKNGITVIAHTPLGRAGLSKQQCNIFKSELLKQLGEKYNKSIAQIVLNASLCFGIGIIPKSQNVKRIEQNYQCWDFQISQSDLKRIKQLNKNFRICDARKMFKGQYDIFQ